MLAEMGVSKKKGADYTGTTLKRGLFIEHKAVVSQEADGTMFAFETDRQGTRNVWTKTELTSEKLSKYDTAHEQTNSVRHDYQNKNYNEMLGDKGAYIPFSNDCNTTSRKARMGQGREAARRKARKAASY
jgi:hypothetical protein